MLQIIVSFFVLAGSFFCLLASAGIVRFPDFLTRMHAAAKAGAFGGSLLLLGAMVHFGSLYVILKCALIILLFYFTTPLASHVLGKAGSERNGEPADPGIDTPPS